MAPLEVAACAIRVSALPSRPSSLSRSVPSMLVNIIGFHGVGIILPSCWSGSTPPTLNETSSTSCRALAIGVVPWSSSWLASTSSIE